MSLIQLFDHLLVLFDQEETEDGLPLDQRLLDGLAEHLTVLDLYRLLLLLFLLGATVAAPAQEVVEDGAGAAATLAGTFRVELVEGSLDVGRLPQAFDEVKYHVVAPAHDRVDSRLFFGTGWSCLSCCIGFELDSQRGIY